MTMQEKDSRMIQKGILVCIEEFVEDTALKI